MTQIDQIIADALAGSPETHVAILAREVVKLREAPAVVVPEPTPDEWSGIAENARSADMVDFLAGAVAYGLWLRGKVRAIPADRVLGEGMVAVDRARLAALESIAAKIEALALGPD